jgi:predicted transposase YdaD
LLESLQKFFHLEKESAKGPSTEPQKLKAKYADRLYQTEINNQKAYLYILFEHKSHPETNIVIDLLQHMTAIWRLDTEQKSKKLPLIIPIVIYHGQRKWTPELRLSARMASTPVELKNTCPTTNIYYMICQDTRQNK